MKTHTANTILKAYSAKISKLQKQQDDLIALAKGSTAPARKFPGRGSGCRTFESLCKTLKNAPALAPEDLSGIYNFLTAHVRTCPGNCTGARLMRTQGMGARY